MKNKYLIFDTNHHATFDTLEVKNGKTVTEDKEWMIDKAKPILLAKRNIFSRFLGESLTPLYLLKWNVLLPVDFEIKEKKLKYNEMLDAVKDEDLKRKLKALSDEDTKVQESTWIFRELVAMSVVFPKAEAKEDEFAVTPEFIKSTVDFRFLKNMKNYAGGEGGGKFNKRRLIDIAFIGGMIMVIFIGLSVTGILKY